MHCQASPLLNNKKLLLSKWTAAAPSNKEKHFLVTKVISPEPPTTKIDLIELEAIHSGRRFFLHCDELTDPCQWLQGWQ